MRKTPFDRFIFSARRAPQLWRLVLGVILIAGFSFLFTLGPIGVAWLLRGADAALGFARELQEPASPRAVLLLLFSFVGMALGTALAVRLLHQRRFPSLFGPRKRVARDFAMAAGVVLMVYAVGMGLWLIQYSPEANLAPTRWLLLLPLALLAVAIQTGAEEMAFRGYLMQQLAARFKSPAVWLILPALAFGAVHFDPGTAGGNVWIIVGSAALFGLVAGDLTARTGSLGAAWGFHFANNTVAILFLSTKGTITGLSLMQTPYGVDNTEVMRALLFGDLAMLLIAWAVLRRLLSPKPVA